MPRKIEPKSAAPSSNHDPGTDPIKGLQTSLDGLEKLAKTVRDVFRNRTPLGLLGLLCLGVVVYGGQFALRSPSFIPSLLPHSNQAAAPVTAASQDLFPEPQTLYIVYHNSDGTIDGAPQKWILHIHGTDTFTGEIELPEQHTKGVLSGYRRDGVAILNYASEKASDSGFGTFYLTSRRPADATKGDVWAGLAVFHDCTTEDQTVCATLRVGSAPAMMSAQADNVDDPNNTYFRNFKDTILVQHLGVIPDQLSSAAPSAQPLH